VSSPTLSRLAPEGQRTGRYYLYGGPPGRVWRPRLLVGTKALATLCGSVSRNDPQKVALQKDLQLLEGSC
jgi:hypothetical protein